MAGEAEKRLSISLAFHRIRRRSPKGVRQTTEGGMNSERVRLPRSASAISACPPIEREHGDGMTKEGWFNEIATFEPLNL